MKNLKVKMALLSICFLVSWIFSVSVQAGQPKFSFRFTGGADYMLIGDTNKNIKGLVDFWRDVARIKDEMLEDKLEQFHMGYEGEAEVMIRFSPQFGVNIGLGYIVSQMNSNQMSSHSPERHQFWNSDNKIEAKPIKIGLNYFIPVFADGKIVLNAGAGYYFTTWSETGHYSEERETSFWGRDWNLKANANKIGFHGGIGFEYEIIKNLSIVIEGYGRYCKIDGLKGDGNVVRSNGTRSDVFGVPLYYYEWRDFITTQAWYPDINLLETPPSGENNKNVRDALIDLSGIAFRTGIRISL